MLFTFTVEYGKIKSIFSERVIIMLIYSTRFRVKEIFTKEQFVKSIIKWCTTKNYPMKDLEKHISEFMFSETDGNQMIEVINSEPLGIIAARHISETKKGCWKVDAILNYDKKILSVYTDYTVNEQTADSHIIRRPPWLINQIINDGFAEDNLGFELKTKAISLDESNKNIFLSAIEQNSTDNLPIVRLSSKSRLNADSLALKLAGLAVVINDPSDLLCSADSEKYSEPIYVFIPHRNPVPFGDYPMHCDIIHVVADFLNSRSYDKLETWEGINGEIIRLKSQEILENLKKESADNEFNKSYLADLEAENEEYVRKYEKLAKELQRLKVENENLNYIIETYSDSGKKLLALGKERDYYPNEQLEIIIDVLKDYLAKNFVKGEKSRRADILKSIIEANPVQGVPKKFKKLIKKALAGYTSNSKKILDAFKQTGIVVMEHTKHFKICYHGDTRYLSEISASSSDYRAGDNAAATINKLMF